MEGELQRIVGANLRRYRLERSYSQEAFAEFMGFHRTYMGSVERGERNLTLQTLEKIALFLQLDPRELLNDPGNPSPVDAAR